MWYKNQKTDTYIRISKDKTFAFYVVNKSKDM